MTTSNINQVLVAKGASGNDIGYSEDIVWDRVSRQLFFAGGDHNDLAQFESYRESTNTWQQLPRPAWMPSGTMHGYDHSAIDPGRRFFYHRPYANNTIRRYHIDTGVWTSLPNPPLGGTACCNAIEYFPEMDGIVWVDALGQVAIFRESTQQWTVLTTSLGAGTTWQMAEYNPVNRLLVFALGNRLYQLSASGQITSLGSLPVALYDGSGFNGVFTVDPVSGEYIISTPANNANRVFHRYNVVTRTSQPLASQPNVGDLRHTMMLATPVATHGVTLFVYCDLGTPCGVLLYKHADSSSLPPPPPPPPTETLLVGSVLPSSRSVQVGRPATAFAAVINAGALPAWSCGLALGTGGAGSFSYQTTNPQTNQLIGTADTPVDIAPGALQTFVFAVTPQAQLAPTDVVVQMDCANTEPAAVQFGVNTLLLSGSSTPVLDAVALAATLNGDGIVTVPGPWAVGMFAVATSNVGIGGPVVATADTRNVPVPVEVTLCETEPATGTCRGAPASSVSTFVGAGATASFAVFVLALAPVPFDPAINRVYVRFQDAAGMVRGATSVAVRTP
ncbi:MAG: hypothetical protein ACREM3_29105 [Candidatus Rokuibacteriota bacterium]